MSADTFATKCAAMIYAGNADIGQPKKTVEKAAHTMKRKTESSLTDKEERHHA